jgi:transposase
MQLKTIVNRVTDYKSFVVGKVRWAEEEGLALEVEMRPRANGRPICSGCGQVRPGYDQSPEPRRFEFVPLWLIPVYLVYCMRRVNCPTCGVKVERVPWADGKSPMTLEYQWFLARWAKRMSWTDVAGAFQVGWDRVYTACPYPDVGQEVAIGVYWWYGSMLA